MSMHCLTITLLLFSGCTAARVGQIQSVTPVQKVIKLLENLRDEVTTEGTDEAATYSKFACFCNTETGTKSSSIESDLQNINLASAEVEDNSAKRDNDKRELTTAQADREKNSRDLTEETARCAKEKVDFETRLTELDTDLNRLNLAKKTIEDAAPASFLAVSEQVKVSIKDLIPGEYETHTGGIVEILEKLLEEFTATRTDTQSEFDKATQACKDSVNALEGKIQANSDDIKRLDTSITSLTENIEKKRGELVDLETSMSEAQLYLKDLTGMCQDRAAEFDQRSKMRHDEAEALNEALSVLKDKVSDNEGARVLLQRPPAAREIPSSMTDQPAAKNTVVTKVPVQKALSFLQARTGRNLDVQRARGQQAALYLRSAGNKMSSTTLASLAEHVGLAAATSDDPFVKVKELIQKLIERLVKEATQEATKKGFCDEQMGKASQSRDFRWADSRKLQTEIAGNGVALDKAKESKADNEKLLQETQDALSSATTIRADEKKVNLKTIKDADEGLEGITEVIAILANFYKQAAKAAFVQASPVIVPADAGESKGAYKGKQTSAQGIMGLLYVIKSDFDHTLKITEAAEKKAAADYESFKQESLAAIKGAETAIENFSDDIESLETKINTGLDNLAAVQGLLDKALQELVDLNPMCVDSGMTHQERVEKREAELKALKCAHVILGGDDFQNEPGCSGGSP